MSYEVCNSEKISCPCGRGKISKVLKTNDWGRTKEDIIIECEQCRKKYKIETSIKMLKPYHETVIIHCVEIEKPNNKIEIFK